MCSHILQHMLKSSITYGTIAVAGPIVFNAAFEFNTLLKRGERERENNARKNSSINLITVNLHYRWPNA